MRPRRRESHSMSCASAWSTTRLVANLPLPVGERAGERGLKHHEVPSTPVTVTSRRAETEPRGCDTAQGAALDPLREKLAGTRRASDSPHHRGWGRDRRMCAAGMVVAWTGDGGEG